jgi:acyl-CoA hydrolase
MVESFAAPDNSNTGKPVSASRVVMTQLVLPSDTNALGSIFGGVIMSWIDICGAVASQRHSSKAVVTASIDELNFIAPVFLGWVVNLKASVNFVSKTSMEVGVRVDAENPRTNEFFHTASAYLTFVALDENRKAIPVRPLILETDEDRRRHEAAAARRALRLANRVHIKK